MECQAAADSLARGARDSRSWGYLVECGSDGAAALATRLATLAGETDTTYLYDLLITLTQVRDAAIFQAARSVLNNPSAAVAARVTALGAAIAQYRPSIGVLGEFGWANTIASPRGRNCRFGYTASGHHRYSAALPTDFEAQLAATLDSVELRPGENAVMRDLAGCARRLIEEVPVNAPATSLTLTYVCGTTFSVANSSARPAILTYRVSSDTLESDLYVQPSSSVRFFTLRSGTVTLFLDGTQILSARNAGKDCP